jgi:hypothetical protein
MSAESSPTHPEAEPNRDAPIISSLKRPINRSSGACSVHADQRESAGAINQIARARHSRERFCGCPRRVNQEPARRSSPKAEGKEQDRVLRRDRRYNRRAADFAILTTTRT